MKKDFLKNSELISIIIPVYNSENTLKRCFDSLIEQSYSNLEFIVINDGSVDQSNKICHDYAKMDKRFKIIVQDNQGVSTARNNGLKQSSGKYICFVDSDDDISKFFIEKLYKKMISSKSDMVVCNMNVITSKREYSKQFSVNLNESFDKITFYKHINEFGGYLWNKIFKKELLYDLEMDKTIFNCEDELFVVNYVERCNSISCIVESLYNYYVNESSSSSWQKWNDRKATIIDAKEKILSIFNKYDITVYKDFYFWYFYHLNDIFHRYSKEYVGKSKLKKVYKKIIHLNCYSFFEKMFVFFFYHFYFFYNILRHLFHFING